MERTAPHLGQVCKAAGPGLIHTRPGCSVYRWSQVPLEARAPDPVGPASPTSKGWTLKQMSCPLRLAPSPQEGTLRALVGGEPWPWHGDTLLKGRGEMVTGRERKTCAWKCPSKTKGRPEGHPAQRSVWQPTSSSHVIPPSVSLDLHSDVWVKAPGYTGLQRHPAWAMSYVNPLQRRHRR